MKKVNFKATQALLNRAETQLEHPERLAIILNQLVDLMKRSEKDIESGKFTHAERVKMAEDCKTILDFVVLHR